MYDDVLDFLKGYRRTSERVRQLDLLIEKLYIEAETTSSAPTDMFVRGSKRKRDRTGELAIKIADISEQLIAQRIEALDRMKEIASVIDAVPDRMQSRLLFERYIEGKDWYDVALDLNFEATYTRGRLHRSALAATRQVLIDAEGKQGTKGNKS